MSIVKLFKINDNMANVFPMPIQRDWMDETFDKHAYHCLPISMGNMLGWGISYPEDIAFIWDGKTNSSNEHVKILKGEKYCHSNRGNATISFNSNFILKTDQNISILQMPPSNMFIDGIYPFTTILSSSFYNHEFPIAWRVTRPNVEITIPANTIITTFLPIPLKFISDFSLEIYNDYQNNDTKNSYNEKIIEINKKGKWSDFYRQGINENGIIIGEHEVKNIKMNVVDYTKEER